MVEAVDEATTAAGEPLGVGLTAPGASVAVAGVASATASSSAGSSVTISPVDSSGTRVVSDQAVSDIGSATVVSEAVGPSEVRQAIVIPNAEAPTSYAFDLSIPDGLSTRLAADGAVEIFATAEGADVIAGRVAPPWAKDANGVDVPTKYSLDGTTITQNVSHSAGVAYPVTADPRVTYGTSVYLNLYGYEANAIALVFNAAALTGVAVGCSTPFRDAVKAALGVGGKVANAVLGLACTFGGATAVAAIYYALTSAPNFDPNTCYQKDLFKSTEGFYTVPASNCA
ncbi:hypothetical protein HQ305_19890 [Rhodococcus sp. BP-149]|uniref:hypothetical protein n=1 Tax=unclassified Rhodococcus (in: high G+C Gram-positive bacteria) TaxID=192944 RepID=UPI001C9A48C9|nr:MULTISPECIES: hypothetical protein [unclassified Rhodococcus (in: high G+C Gram-positive bacteria)]MBY6687498.1 hypothetical protein [Rhodococcus sp. BP-288]MBY6696407.1 hypothetical protein [Rhodococcus sp. BP-188]MBY6700539.1 hypothetical protein [Rhodococcus sp. BP-285]MBY6704438.1 hypothetical protein [Rhodococcus sp. BP-283]MBY6713664.1 hypothetical protein [Rhodococcus sp. BP-160]